MSDDLDALRQLAAAEHGLSAEAEAFLTGTSLAELDEGASLFAKLLGDRRMEQRAATRPGPFTAMAAAKAGRKQELAAIFTGRVRQPRDTRRRFATDFSRGARQPVPPPPETHNETLARLLRTGAANAGGRGF
jgi:hypothetical protein